MALAGAMNYRRGDLSWRTRGKKLRTRREQYVIFGRREQGGRGADRRTGGRGRTKGGRADCGERVDGRRTGGRADVGQRRGG